MTALDYYDPLYHSLPWWHKSIGLLVIVLWLVRIIWKLFNPQPLALETHQQWEQYLAHFMQQFFYLLIFLIAFSGYFIATAKGKGVEFFNLLEIPAITTEIKEEVADLIGNAHQVMAILLAFLVVLHALAALKHHFINKDKTLTRMLSDRF